MVILFLKTKFWLFKEELKCRRLFYKNRRFKIIDRMLRRSYFFRNPYQICRKYLQKKGAQEIHAYGETPLTTMQLIANECEISPSDVVIEMGCGRGRSCFFLKEYVGCRVQGIECIPLFVSIATQVAEQTKCSLISFICADMMEADLSSATVVYLYGSCLSDEEITTLIKKFALLADTVKIITVSYPLSDYSKHFKTIKQFTASFPWGETVIYLNCRS